MGDRSSRQDVRNPCLSLPSVQRLLDMPEGTRLALSAVLDDLHKDATARAQKCWVTHKAPMAAYWKAVAVYAGHLRRAIRAGKERPHA